MNFLRRKKKAAKGAPDMIERRLPENAQRRIEFDAAQSDADKAAARASLDLNAARTAHLRKTIQVMTIRNRVKEG